MKLKNLTYTGHFEDATCGLAHPFREGFAVGCGKRAQLERFGYTLEDGKTRSTVALCPACAAGQMKHRRVRWGKSNYALYVGDVEFAVAFPSDGGWLCRVKVAGQQTQLWAKTLGEVEDDALVWYRFFTKGL